MVLVGINATKVFFYSSGAQLRTWRVLWVRWSDWATGFWTMPRSAALGSGWQDTVQVFQNIGLTADFWTMPGSTAAGYGWQVTVQVLHEIL